VEALGPLVGLAHQHLETFLLVFARIGAMVMLAPVLGHRSIPATHRAGLALLLALVLTPLVAAAGRPPAEDLLALLLAVAGEVFIGLAIGFVAALLLAAVEGASELVTTQMGLGLSVLYDPATGGQPSVVGRFQSLLALLLFLALNGHHLLLQAVAVSFRRLRPGALVLAPEVPGGLVGLGGKLLRSGLEIAAPVLGLLLVVNVLLAFLARVAPQTNVFLLGVPVTIAVGLLGLAESVPVFAAAVRTLLERMAGDIEALLTAAHGAR
jgi:flagellar biosynthetic protein FliR